MATLLAQHHSVTAVDVIAEKVEKINRRESPIQDEYIEKYFAEKELDLVATLDGAAAYRDAEFVIIAAPTNYDSKKNYFDTSAADSSQRMLNAIEPGSVVPVHRHRGSSETLVVLRGRVVEEYYDSEGVCVATYELAAGGPAFGLNIPAGQWHSLRALDPGTVILEMKDGAYEPISPADMFSM